MNAPIQPDPMADPHAGWLRESGGRWRRAVTGDDYDQTLGRLLDHTRQLRGSFDLMVLPAGDEPTTSRPRAGRSVRAGAR